VQEAEMSAAPAVWRTVTTPAVLTVAISGFEVLQVIGGLLNTTSRVSTTVATTVFVPPALMMAVFPEPPWTWSIMDFTRQVV
jgi:hypothetical protein